MKKKEYYGIYFNKDIPKIDDKINKYNKEVEIIFEGKAYLVERDEDNNIKEKIEIDNKYKLKKEKDYEIEFINNDGKIYWIKVRIESSYLFLLLLLFIIGFIIGLALCKPFNPEASLLHKLYDYINISLIQLDVDENSENTVHYDFDVSFENISSEDINLTNTINAKSLVKNKICPGTSGSFSIIITTKSSTVDMRYKVLFENITNDKTSNMCFKIRGTDEKYSTLQELEKSLSGIIKKKSQEEIIIDWEWMYETGENQNTIIQNDQVDTFEGRNLESYIFKILVTGEEVI